MKYFIGFSQYGIDLPDGLKTKDEMINAYVESMGGSQTAFDHFLNHMHFFEDNIKEAEIVKEENNDSGTSMQEATN